MTSVKPSQNFEPGTCPFINLHFDLKQFDGKEHECKCLALVTLSMKNLKFQTNG